MLTIISGWFIVVSWSANAVRMLCEPCLAAYFSEEEYAHEEKTKWENEMAVAYYRPVFFAGGLVFFLAAQAGILGLGLWLIGVEHYVTLAAAITVLHTVIKYAIKLLIWPISLR